MIFGHVFVFTKRTAYFSKWFFLSFQNLVSSKKLAFRLASTPGPAREAKAAQTAVRLRNGPAPEKLELEEDEKHRLERVRRQRKCNSFFFLDWKETLDWIFLIFNTSFRWKLWSLIYTTLYYYCFWNVFLLEGFNALCVYLYNNKDGNGQFRNRSNLLLGLIRTKYKISSYVDILHTLLFFINGKSTFIKNTSFIFIVFFDNLHWNSESIMLFSKRCRCNTPSHLLRKVLKILI